MGAHENSAGEASMKRLFGCVLAAIALFLATVAPAFAESVHAEIVYRGVIDCFDPPPETEIEQRLTYCEASAAIFAENELFEKKHIYIASDKDLDIGPAVIELDLEDVSLERDDYLRSSPILRMRKAEDFARVPNSERVFLTSGFDRVKEDSTEWDAYNMLITWKADREDEAIVVEPTGEPPSSLRLKTALTRALITPEFPAGAPYFKIEGLAMLPDERLVFGVREIGKAYNDFKYTVQLVAGQWDPDCPQDLGNLERIYSFDPGSNSTISEPIGLSSIAWDRFGDRLLILTSYETEETDTGLGAYLWVLSQEDLEQENPPTLVTKANGEPLVFAHKAEGVTVISEDQILVVHDDDRILGDPDIGDPEHEFYREAHQAAYTLVDWL